MLRCLFLFFLFGQLVSAQEFTSTKIDSALQKFHANKSIALHIHSNKNVYISDEKIWFSIYAFETESATVDANNHNIVVQLTDSNNKAIAKSLLYVNNGQTNGNFTLSPKTETNTYYLKAFITNNPSTIFTKAIKIINPSITTETKDTANNSTKLDVQILPEGGHLISDVVNTCGIKILNSNGKGIQLKNLILEDEKGKILKNNLATNALGMGKFSFVPKENTNYYLCSKTSSFKQQLPQIQNFGIALKLEQNFKTGELQIELNTNKKSLKTFSNQDITITIHKESLAYSYTTKFEKDYPKLVLNIPSSKLFSGTNIITVFNEDFKPLVERLFFNFNSLKNNSSFISEASKNNDTLTYNIINKQNKETIKTQTSISVLPLKSIANNNRDNLFASVYLKPFLKGSIENPSYYFQKNNNQKRFEMDLLLLNQGWSKYKWNTIFNTKKPNTLNNDSGLTISGYVVPLDKKQSLKSVLLYSKKNKNIKMVDLEKDDRFTINNLVLKTDSEFEFSALDISGKPVKANFFFTVKPLNRLLDKTFEIDLTNPFNETNLSENIIDKFEGESLDEVVINAKKLLFEKFTQDRYGIKVDSSLHVYQTIGNYFKMKEALEEKMFLGSMYSPPGLDYAYRFGGGRAVFYVDGKRATLSNGLLNISMKHVIELYHGGKDAWGNRRSHIIFTDRKYDTLPEHLKTSKVFKLQNGFTFQKETYKPEYINYESETYQKFAAIAWEPLVRSNENGYNKMTLVNPGKHDLLFHIEGFTETGEPFSTITSYKNIRNN